MAADLEEDERLGATEDDDDAEAPPVEAEKAIFPLVEFSSRAAGLGHINLFPDSDGTIRRAPLAAFYGGGFYPHYSLELLRTYLGLGRNEIQIAPGEKIKLGKVEAPIVTGRVGLSGVDNAFTALGDPEVHAKILVDPTSDAVEPA